MPTASQNGGLKTRKSNIFFLNLSKRVALVFIIGFACVVVLDTTIVKYITYSGTSIPSISNIVFFVALTSAFVIMGILLLNTVKRVLLDSTEKLSIFRYFYTGAFVVYIFNVGIILSIIFQMILENKYSVILLQTITILSHFSALIFLLSLVIIFIGWLRSKRNYMIILYVISLLSIISTIIVSFCYLEMFLLRSSHDSIGSYPVSSYVGSFYSTPFAQSLSGSFTILSVVSFLVMWAATMILLGQYRHKLGRVSISY